MKLITWNVNGLRAVERKGELSKLVGAEKPEVLMLQEVKAQPEQVAPFAELYPDYQQHYSFAEKKGYSGSALWLHKELAEKIGEVRINREIKNAPNADEGRVVHASFELAGQGWDLLSIYFPNGGKSEQAWAEKLVFYRHTGKLMDQLRAAGRVVLVGGDMNVAHMPIDLARPDDNDGKIGFHPDERAWMDGLVKAGWVDAWRRLNPEVRDVYSWWHMVSRSRERNVGWRIDYFLLAEEQFHRVRAAEYLNAQMGSDHCPLRLVLGG